MSSEQQDWELVAKEYKTQNTGLHEEVRALKAAMDTIGQKKAGERLALFEKEQKKWLAYAENIKGKWDKQEAVISERDDTIALLQQEVAALKEQNMSLEEAAMKQRYAG